MKGSRLAIFAIALALGSVIEIARGDVLGTAFTYQGQLKDAGVPADGDYDFVFRLFDAATDGMQIGSDFPVDDWPVSDGLFTVQVDFGDSAFNSEARWLEVAVRPWDSNDPHTVLSPRQPVTAAPVALYALDGPGSGGYWTLNGDDIYNTNAGGVGIGTTNPGSPLHVKATTSCNAILAESGGSGYQCAIDAFVESPEGNAIFAFNEGWTGNAYAIVGDTASPSGTAIYGWASNADLWDSSNIGVHGRSDGDNNAVGVYGEATNTNPDGTTYGVRGVSVEGTGVRGENTTTGNYGSLGSLSFGLRGVAEGGGTAVVGIAGGWGPAGSFVISDDTNDQPAVKGRTNNPDGYAGYFTGGRSYFEGHVGIGTTSPAAMLDLQSTEVTHGIMSTVPSIAVWAHRTATTGTYPAIHGECDSEAANGSAIRGIMTSTSPGSSSAAVRGANRGTGAAGIGVWGSQDGSGYGVYGYAPSGRGVYGLSTDGVGVYGRSTNGYAGYFNGTVSVDVLEITGADVAEKFPVSEQVKPGMVVAIDAENPGRLCLARGAYNRRVAGVVSGAGNIPTGTILGNLPGSEDAPAIALNGRVWVYGDATEQPIVPGDLLTTAACPGHAMKVTDYEKAQGAVLGKAMTGLEEGTGLVLVLVNLQ